MMYIDYKPLKAKNLNQELVKTFFRFLKEKHAYYAFIEEAILCCQRKCEDKTTVEDYVFSYLQQKPKYIIDYSLTWNDTKKGFRYWDTLDTEWMNVYEKMF